MFKKKILIVCTTSLTFENILKDQPAFLNKFFSVTVASSNNIQLRNFAKSQSLDYAYIPMYRKINPFFDFYSIYVLYKYIKKNRPDIIHSFTPKAGLICSVAGFFANVEMRLHTFTGLIFPYKKGLMRIILSLIDRLICHLNTHVIAEGKGVKNQLVNNKITRKKIYLIGNGNIAGVDIDFFNKEHFRSNSINYLKNKKESYNFTFVGRLNKDKGIEELLKSFEEIKDVNINLFLVGDFENEDNFSRKVENSFIKKYKYIHHAGWCEDIRPYLMISDCLILPSYREGFPNVLLQAGSFSLPSIVTNVPGSNEIIREGYNGWIVQPRDKNSLKNKIEQIISIPKKELRKFGDNARDNVVENYDQIKFRKKLIKFYQEL